jgi:hypothetical protein
MAKIAFDKYYTPPTVARWCIDKTYEILGKENIKEVIEPSAGCGMFSHQMPGCLAYDLYPQHEYIEQADFTELQMEYKKGRLFIGNPPFGGSTGKLIKEFYNKSCDGGDYIAFILPASYYWNYRRLYKFEIVYSCIIETPYTNETLKTSFTIYKRNDEKKDWRPEKVARLKDITIKKYVRQNIKEGETKKPVHARVDPYDICVNLWGKPLLKTKPYKHVQVATIKIHNEELRYKILEALQWAYEENMRTGFLSIKSISATQISIEDVEKLLRVLVPEIK